MEPIMKHLILPLLAILLLTSPTLGSPIFMQNDPPTPPPAHDYSRLDINLDRSRMFVPLPPEVTTVTQSPDSRVWLTIQRLEGNRYARFTRADMHVIIRREFAEKMPQIPNAYPILFEPTGRIWFKTGPLCDDEENLTTAIIGYDGKNFTTPPDDSPLHNHKLDQPTNDTFPLAEGYFWKKGNAQTRPSLFDPTGTKVLHTIPLWGIDAINAAMNNDGTVFFTKNKRHYVYHPDGKDHRTPLQPAHTLRGSNGILTGDGAYWFTQTTGEWDPNNPEAITYTTARFDGKEIKTFSKFRSYSSIFPGHDGFLRFSGNNEAPLTLISPRSTFIAQNLEDLIAKHPTEVAKTFTGPRPMGNHNPTMHIQADTNANIWILKPHLYEIKVFSPTLNKWLNAKDTITQAGNSNRPISHLLPLGKKILAIRNFYSETEKTKSIFILAIENENGGKVKVEALDDIHVNLGYYYYATAIYSPLGEPWLSITRTDANNKSTRFACRFNDTGIVQTIENLVPVATDANGSLLTADISNTSYRTTSPIFKFIHGPKPFTTQLPASTIPRPHNEKLTFIAPATLAQTTDLGTQLTYLSTLANTITYNLDTPSQPETITYSPLGFAAIQSAKKLDFFPLKKP